MRLVARVVLAGITLRVEGLEHVPKRGPALLVCRHYHHLYDGAILTLALKRPVRILVALDWAKDTRQRRMMEFICGLARWPIVLRRSTPESEWGGGYDPHERSRYVREALVRSAKLLSRGDVLAIFPEGYPTVDPVATRKRDGEWLPFAPGYLAVAERARRGGALVPLVPAGLSYAGPSDKPTSITLRFGAPETIGSAAERHRVASSLEERVHALSA
jgi:1-acyl-sn-glycerol-3-phosphate acyltransferase